MQHDIILWALISMAESEPPIEHDVTLIVGGFLISGFVVSYENYLKHHVVTKMLDEKIQKCIAELPEPSESVDSDEPQDNTPNYIHLRDAKCFTPGQNPIPGNMGVYYRIPLAHVQGFSFGLLCAETR